MEKEKYYSLTNFTGPIDLLFFLIQRDELNIFDIELKRLTEQHLTDSHDLDEGADFLFFASLLLLYKSRRLLSPTTGETIEEFEISPELFEHLLQYEKFKELALRLEQKEAEEKGRFAREVKEEKVTREINLNKVDLKDLGSLLTELLEKKRKRGGLIREEKWLLADKIEEIQNILRTQKELLFRELFCEEKPKEELIVLFLALLELLRQKKVCYKPKPETKIIWNDSL